MKLGTTVCLLSIRVPSIASVEEHKSVWFQQRECIGLWNVNFRSADFRCWLIKELHDARRNEFLSGFCYSVHGVSFILRWGPLFATRKADDIEKAPLAC